MTSPRIFPCSSTIDFSFRIVPLSSPRTSRRIFQVSEREAEPGLRRASRGNEARAPLSGVRGRLQGSIHGWWQDQIVLGTIRFQFPVLNSAPKVAVFLALAWRRSAG